MAFVKPVLHWPGMDLVLQREPTVNGGTFGRLSVNGTPIARRPDGRLIFGNGITGGRNAFGWTSFTSGVMIRHDTLGNNPDAYLINPDLFCESEGDKKAHCRKR